MFKDLGVTVIKDNNTNNKKEYNNNIKIGFYNGDEYSKDIIKDNKYIKSIDDGRKVKFYIEIEDSDFFENNKSYDINIKSNIYTYNTYAIGYKPKDYTQPVVIVTREKVKVPFEYKGIKNEVTPSFYFRIKKVDHNDNEKLLKGAMFDIIRHNAKSTIEQKDCETNDSGICIFNTVSRFEKNTENIGYFNFNIKEIKAPTDYLKVNKIYINGEWKEINDSGIDICIWYDYNNSTTKLNFGTLPVSKYATVDKLTTNVMYEGNNEKKGVLNIELEKNFITLTIPNLKDECDLALRQTISGILKSHTGVSDFEERKDEINVQDCVSMIRSNNLYYTNKKNPIKVSKNEVVVYKISVYNEGTVNNNLKKIKFYIPDGLKYWDSAGTFESEGWKYDYDEDRNIITVSTKEENGIKIKNLNNAKVIREKLAGDGAKDYQYFVNNGFIKEITIACQVTGEKSGEFITIAEIADASSVDSIDDRDSTPANIFEKLGINNNQENVSELISEYCKQCQIDGIKEKYYCGIEDDDDFEHIIVEENYNIELIKKDATNNREITNMKFKIDGFIYKNDITVKTDDDEGTKTEEGKYNRIEITEDTDNEGKINHSQVIDENHYNSTDIYEITEDKESAESKGYIQLRQFRLDVTKGLGDKGYSVKSCALKVPRLNETHVNLIESTDDETEYRAKYSVLDTQGYPVYVILTLDKTTNKITLEIPNRPQIKGEYEVRIKKTDVKGNALSGANFKVNGIGTSNTDASNGGIVSGALTTIDEDTVNTTIPYLIEENKEPDGDYYKMLNQIKLNVKTTYNPNTYEVKITEARLEDKTVIFEDNTTGEAEVSRVGNVITVTIPNKERIRQTDLSLTQDIIKVNNKTSIYGKNVSKETMYSSNQIYQYTARENQEIAITYEVRLKHDSGDSAIINKLLYWTSNDLELNKIYAGNNYGRLVNGDGGNPLEKPKPEPLIGGVNKYSVENLNISLTNGEVKYLYLEFIVKSNKIDTFYGSTFKNYAEIGVCSLKDTDSYPGEYSDEYSGENPGKLEPGTVKINKMGTGVPGVPHEDDDDNVMLYIKLAKIGEGKVFIDEPLAEKLSQKERIGNGTYDDGEDGVKNVKVTLWRKVGNDNKEEVCSTITDADGNYDFSNYTQEIEPGRYYIEFSWGEGVGTKIGESGPNINVDEYKSTIWNSNNRRQKNSGNYWYKNGTERYSDAQDDYNLREILDGKTGNDEDEDIPLYEILTSGTGTGNAIMIARTREMRLDESQYPGETFKNIDLGLIERPHQSIEIEKNVKTVEIITDQGQTIAKAHMGDDNKLVIDSGSITSEPKAEGKLGWIKVETDKDLLDSGTNAKVEYQISITNTGEHDYANENYYWYGTNKLVDDEIGIKPLNIEDYVRGLNSDVQKNTAWEKAESVKDWTNVNTISQYVNKTLKDETSSFNRYVTTEDGKTKIITEEKGTKMDAIINGFITEYDYQGTTEFKNVIKDNFDIFSEFKYGLTLYPGDEPAKITYTGVTQLSSDKELEFDNIVQIGDVKKDRKAGRTIMLKESNFFDKAQKIIVTPPTGEKFDHTSLIILAISTLITLGTAFVFIKRIAIK